MCCVAVVETREIHLYSLRLIAGHDQDLGSVQVATRGYGIFPRPSGTMPTLVSLYTMYTRHVVCTGSLPETLEKRTRWDATHSVVCVVCSVVYYDI